jgi:hypothetical protein
MSDYGGDDYDGGAGDMYVDSTSALSSQGALPGGRVEDIPA